MRIAMITNNYKPFVGGVPISIERQATALRKLGHQVVIFAPDYGQAEEEPDVVRCEIRGEMINGMVYPKVINRQVLEGFRRMAFDCIHVHQPMFAGNTALYLGKKYDIPVLYTYHTRYEDYLHYIPLFRKEEEAGWLRKKWILAGRNKVIPAYMKWFTDQCDMVLAPSQGMKDKIEQQGTGTKVELFPTGLEEGFYVEHKQQAEEIRKAFAGDSTYLFCTVSRMEEEKNLFFLLRGIRELKAAGKASFKVLFLGDGSSKKALQQQAKKWNIEEETVFLGNVPNAEIPGYLQASDLFLFTSKSETQGMVIQEALAAGCPVIAVKASGVEDAIENGRNGFLTPEDVGVWSRKVWAALEPELLEKMKFYAKESAQKYRLEYLAEQEEGFYRKCVEERWKEGMKNGKKRITVSVSGIFKTS